MKRIGMRLWPLLAILLLVGGCQAADGIYSVRSFGARGDGQTLDTDAVNKAISAAADSGGGTVRFSAGTYLCYSIHLRSNTTIYLDQGVKIVAAGTNKAGQFDPPEPFAWDHYMDFGHSHWHNSLFWGEDLQNVAIEGPGMIWGRGLSHGNNLHPERKLWPYGLTQDAGVDATTKPSAEPEFPNPKDALPAGVANKTIALKNCHNVILRDFSILNGGHFALLLTAVDNLTIDNLKLDTDRDGMDIDCCRNVRVSNCSINSPWDDGLCLKSSFGPGYNRSTENVTITNCFVTGGYEEGTMLDGTYKKIGLDYSPDHRASRTGRIKFGTESNGGFKNIAISNCVIDNCGGLALESVDGAIIEDVAISNLTMRDIVNNPIFIRLGSRLRGPKDQTVIGAIRRVNISNIVVVNSAARFAGLITGIPGHDIEDLHISNMQILYPGGVTLKQAATQPEEQANQYPEPARFRGMPAYGFFIRHVNGIDLTDIDLSYVKQDMRPAFYLDDVKEADFTHIKAPHAPGRPNIILQNVDGLSIHQYRGVPDCERDHVGHEQF
ncbi:MAG: glycosyl hydrolase family 28-related protein [Tepidisphaeraceae bacterium]|jgi:polygalacturonase